MHTPSTLCSLLTPDRCRNHSWHPPTVHGHYMDCHVHVKQYSHFSLPRKRPSGLASPLTIFPRIFPAPCPARQPGATLAPASSPPASQSRPRLPSGGLGKDSPIRPPLCTPGLGASGSPWLVGGAIAPGTALGAEPATGTPRGGLLRRVSCRALGRVRSLPPWL